MDNHKDILSPSRNTNDIGSPSRNKKNNGWSTKKEKLLKYWQEECRLYVWLHNKNSAYYRRLNRLFALPSILITAITGTALFSTAGTGGDDERIISICFGFMLIIGTFLQSTREFLDIEKQIHRNASSGISYQSIVNEIEEQLTQDTIDRIDGKLFLRKIKNSKNDIVRNGPSISSKTWDKLKTSMKKGDVINLYGTDFFQGYITKLDILERDGLLSGNEDNKYNEHNIDNELNNQELSGNHNLPKRCSMHLKRKSVGSGSVRYKSSLQPPMVSNLKSPPRQVEFMPRRQTIEKQDISRHEYVRQLNSDNNSDNNSNNNSNNNQTKCST